MLPIIYQRPATHPRRRWVHLSTYGGVGGMGPSSSYTAEAILPPAEGLNLHGLTRSRRSWWPWPRVQGITRFKSSQSKACRGLQHVEYAGRVGEHYR